MDPSTGGTILLDLIAGPDARFDEGFLEHVGHHVLTCPGPSPDETCPLLVGDRCALFEAAHAIVFKLDLDREQHRRILRRYQDLAPEGMPIAVVTGHEQAERYRAELADVVVWTHQPTASELDGFAAEVEAFDRFEVP